MILSVVTITAWKVSWYGVISGPYFPVFGLNSIRTQENTDQKKLRIWTLFTQCIIYNQSIDLYKIPYPNNNLNWKTFPNNFLNKFKIFWIFQAVQNKKNSFLSTLCRRRYDVATQMLFYRRLQDVINHTFSRRRKWDIFKTS